MPSAAAGRVPHWRTGRVGCWEWWRRIEGLGLWSGKLANGIQKAGVLAWSGTLGFPIGSVGVDTAHVRTASYWIR